MPFRIGTGDPIRSAGDAFRLFGTLFANGRPGLRVAHLDRELRLIGLAAHAGPLLGADTVRPILRAALSCGAHGLVVASAGTAFDEAEAIATRRLANAGRPLEVHLLDRLLFAAGGCVSLRQQGML